MKRSAFLLCALLAACGSGAERPSDAEGAATDSAALDAVTHPSDEPRSPLEQTGAVKNVNRRLDEAQKAETARQQEAAQQVREAEGGASPP